MLSPALARWITATFEGVDAFSLEYLGYREAKDPRVIAAARRAGAVVLTKDSDFGDEAERVGTPRVLWVRSPNTATRDLKPVLLAELPAALEGIRAGEPVVLIGREDESF